MPPKVKITKVQILDIAVDIVRNHGIDSVNAREIASILCCSTQPIFSNFATMRELRLAIIQKANSIFQEYMRREAQCGRYPLYKANGMAYIRFAKEEKELFKLLYMRDRSQEELLEELEINSQQEEIVQHNTGLNEMDAKLFHLEMWAFVHGIATMFATDFLDLDWEIVSKMLTDSYQGLKKQYGTE